MFPELYSFLGGAKHIPMLAASFGATSLLGGESTHDWGSEKQSWVVAQERRPSGLPVAQDTACANRDAQPDWWCITMLEFCELLALLLVNGQGRGHDNEGLVRHACMPEQSGGAQHGRPLVVVMRAGENEVFGKSLVTFRTSA